MPDEIKIVATLDTADVASGTERIAAAVKGIKQQVHAASEGTEAEEAGESFGDKFMHHFVEHLLIRDAIRQMLDGAVEIFESAGSQIGTLLGTKVEISFKSAMDRIGSALGYLAVGKLAYQAGIEAAQENIEKIQSDESHRIEMDKFKKNPLNFRKSSNQIEGEIESNDEAQAQSKIKNQQIHEALLAEGKLMPGITGAFVIAGKGQDADEALKDQLTDLIDKRKDLNEQLEIAKRKEEELAKMQRSWNEETKKATNEAKRKADEEDRRRSDNMIKTALAQREIEKKEKRIGIENAITADNKVAKTAGTDLSFDRTQIEHQKATSAVSINGSIYGTNDSAATLVQHAATQVSLLRQIEENTKSLRQQNQELTLQ